MALVYALRQTDLSLMVLQWEDNADLQCGIIPPSILNQHDKWRQNVLQDSEGCPRPWTPRLIMSHRPENCV